MLAHRPGGAGSLSSSSSPSPSRVGGLPPKPGLPYTYQPPRQSGSASRTVPTVLGQSRNLCWLALSPAQRPPAPAAPALAQAIPKQAGLRAPQQRLPCSLLVPQFPAWGPQGKVSVTNKSPPGAAPGLGPTLCRCVGPGDCPQGPPHLSRLLSRAPRPGSSERRLRKLDPI